MFKSLNWLALITGVLFIFCGCVMFTNPVLNMAILGWLFSISVLVDGIMGIFDYFVTTHQKRSVWNLVLAMLTTIIGVSLVSDTLAEQAAFVPFLLAFWLIFIGISRIIFGIQETRLVGKKAAMLLGVSGAAFILLGLLALAHPWFSGTIVVYVFGLTLLCIGMIRIIEFFTMRKDGSSLSKQSTTAETEVSESK